MLTHLRRPAIRSRFLARLAVLLAAFGTALAAMACDRMPLTAPTGTVISLYASSTVLAANSSIEITAVAIEGGAAASTGGTGTTPATSTSGQGTPVHNGTVLTFTTNIGRIEPQEAKTHNGRVTVTLFSDGASGVATVRAFSGGASASLTVNVGAAAAARLDLSAEPTTLSSFGGTATLTARVFDNNGNPLPGVPVNFSVETGGGSFSSPTAVTDSGGVARTTITTNRETTVVATAGVANPGTGGAAASTLLTAKVTLRINVASTLALAANPTNPVENQPVTFTITPGGGATGTANIIRNTVIDFGDGARIPLGNVSSPTTVAHTYVTGGRIQAFQVTASGTDINGETVSGTIVVVVNPQLPLAVTLTATPSTARRGVDRVTFTATVSGGSPILYIWDFGDGTSATTTGPTTSHVYPATTDIGPIRVTVRVQSNNAGEGLGETTVIITTP